MDKILFHTNSFEQLKKYLELHKQLKALGWEVAFSTDSWELARLMAIGFLLVVKINTYYPDFIVTDEPIKADNIISLEDLKESLQ